jgi:sulfide dehydrogenase [flavocytochrome c] flavoprotein chain
MKNIINQHTIVPALHRRKLLTMLGSISLTSIFSSCTVLNSSNNNNNINNNNINNNNINNNNKDNINNTNTDINNQQDNYLKTQTVAQILSLGHVIIIGGGFGGATAAKYLKLWGDGRIAVTLIERQAHFISCPMSNLVIGGSRQLSELTFSYEGLKELGITVVHAEVTEIDSLNKRVIVNDTHIQSLAYDRLILSPGVDFLFDSIDGLDTAAQKIVLHAWKAGLHTQQLRQQIEAIPNGGTVAISIPKAPYRCPPGPYERACQIAHYFKKDKPHSKVIILDANEDIQSKKVLFTHEWDTTYKGIIEYQNRWELKRLNVATRTLENQFGDSITADVINIIPPMQAGIIAYKAGVVNSTDKRWCQVDWLSMESTAVKYIHILGDAVQSAPGMPKSGHIANQHGKIAASAIVELFNNRTPLPLTIMNTCYSYVDATRAIHVASTHRFDNEQKMYMIIKNTGGLSKEANTLEGQYAWAWAQTIWNDMLS